MDEMPIACLTTRKCALVFITGILKEKSSTKMQIYYSTWPASREGGSFTAHGKHMDEQIANIISVLLQGRALAVRYNRVHPNPPPNHGRTAKGQHQQLKTDRFGCRINK